MCVKYYAIIFCIVWKKENFPALGFAFGEVAKNIRWIKGGENFFPFLMEWDVKEDNETDEEGCWVNEEN